MSIYICICLYIYMSIYLYVYKKMFIYNKTHFDINDSDTIYTYTYIYIHAGCIIYHVSNRTYILLQVRVINVFQTNQKKTKTKSK